ncbi:hypothetical protein JCM8547_001253 [Rhodosporidiobolus lusitaniae]
METTDAPSSPPAAPPLPPRREASPSAPASSSAKPASSWWERAKGSTAEAWNSAYKQVDKVGYWSNKQADKAFYPTSLDIESTKAARILRTFTMDAADLPDEISLADRRKSQVVLKKIPPPAIASASGLAIFTVFRSGFVVSAASGSGVVMSRLKDGTWSAPSGILIHTVGFGFSAGVDVYDVVLILRNEKAVDSFKHPRISLGGEISIAAGPVGNGMAIETSHAISPCWSYVKSKGLFAGVSLEGTVLIERNDENARLYGKKVKASEILDGEVYRPHWVQGLHETILAAEGLDYRPELIPQGPSVSECAPSPNPNAFAATDPTISSPSTASPHSSPPTASSPNVSFLSSFSRTTSQTSGVSSRSRASSSAASVSSNSTAIRRLPKEELDDEDLAAQKELEAALREFGIDDVNVNAKSRAEDPLLVVEEKDEVEEPPAAAATGLGVSIPGENLLSDEVEHPPESPSVEAKKKDSAEMSRNASGAGEKPPVPPRRTPRIGTAASSAAASPVVAQGEDKEKEEAEEQKKEDGAEEDKKDLKEGEVDSKSEDCKDAEEGAAVGEKEGEEKKE